MFMLDLCREGGFLYHLPDVTSRSHVNICVIYTCKHCEVIGVRDLLSKHVISIALALGWIR